MSSRPSPISDVSEAYLSVTDITQYLYCPRVVYFDKILHCPRLLQSQQAASRRTHIELEEKEKRRKAAIFYGGEFGKAEKVFHVSLESHRLRLRGVLDLLIHSDSEYIPVDYKQMQSRKGRIWLDHKYQLTAYALLIDEAYNTTVRRGIVYYINEDLVLPCAISQGMKRHAVRITTEIHALISRQVVPPITVEASRCSGGCGFLWVCQRK